MYSVYRIILGLSVLALLSTSSFSQTKCVDANGKVTYSDKPCTSSVMQKSMNLGGTGGEAQQGGSSSNTALAKLEKEQQRLKWVIQGFESDVRAANNASVRNEAARELNKANADLSSVQEQIFQIKDPSGYQQYVNEKRERQRDQQLTEIQRSSAAAEQSSAAAARSSAAAARSAEDAARESENYRAQQQRRKIVP